MTYVEFNKKIIAFIVFTMVLVGLFNYFIDPFYVFKAPLNSFNFLKPDLKKQERMTKLLSVQLSKDKIDTVFVGSSRVDYSINPNYIKQKYGKNAVNLAVKGGDIKKSKYLIKETLKYHPEVKEIVVGIDLFGFKKSKYDDSKGFEYNSFIKNLLTALFSYDGILSSIATVEDSLKKDYAKIYFNLDGIKINNGTTSKYDIAMAEMEIYINSDEFYKNFELSEKKLNSLSDIKKLCDEKNIKLIVFVNPVNVSQLQVLDVTYNFENFGKWKEKVAEITPFYDFSGLNKITLESMKTPIHYYIDSNHYTEIVGNMIIDRLFSRSFPDDFGVLITKDNVKENNIKISRQNDMWKKENTSILSDIQALKQW